MNINIMNINIRTYALIAALSAPLLLSGCGLSAQDGAPRDDFDFSHVADATPKNEPHSRGGNKSYTVFRKHYHVLSSSQGYRQQGIASWYGRKWHGRRTANGEVYNMYAMTAAHKNLPLPTYAKVTNLDNGKSIVVRINDRGPFSGNRIIDLSYTAAAKLGVVQRGLARVEIEALDPSARHRHPALPKASVPTTAHKKSNKKSPQPRSSKRAIPQQHRKITPKNHAHQIAAKRR